MSPFESSVPVIVAESALAVAVVVFVVEVAEDIVTPGLTGIDTGQKYQVLRLTDQYRSTTKRRYPIARRLEKHCAASC